VRTAVCIGIKPSPSRPFLLNLGKKMRLPFSSKLPAVRLHGERLPSQFRASNSATTFYRSSVRLPPSQNIGNKLRHYCPTLRAPRSPQCLWWQIPRSWIVSKRLPILLSKHVLIDARQTEVQPLRSVVLKALHRVDQISSIGMLLQDN
jgi:hypothetical protein